MKFFSDFLAGLASSTAHLTGIQWVLIAMAFCGVAFTTGIWIGRAEGYSNCRVEQAEADRKGYADIIRKLQDERVDPADPVAVDEFLRQLAE